MGDVAALPQASVDLAHPAGSPPIKPAKTLLEDVESGAGAPTTLGAGNGVVLDKLGAVVEPHPIPEGAGFPVKVRACVCAFVVVKQTRGR